MTPPTRLQKSPWSSLPASREINSDPATATGFWARRSKRPSLVRSLTTTPSGIEEEVVVGSGGPRKTKSLEVRVVFEPSRIAPACVTQAYERVVPIARRGIAAERGGRGAGRDGHQHQQRRTGVVAR